MYESEEERITKFYEMLDTSQSEGQEVDMQDENFDWEEDFDAYEASKAELLHEDNFQDYYFGGEDGEIE